MAFRWGHRRCCPRVACGGVRWIEWASVPCAPRVRRAVPGGLRRRAGSSGVQGWFGRAALSMSCGQKTTTSVSKPSGKKVTHRVFTCWAHVHGEKFFECLSREPSLSEHDGRDLFESACGRVHGWSVCQEHQGWFRCLPQCVDGGEAFEGGLGFCPGKLVGSWCSAART